MRQSGDWNGNRQQEEADMSEQMDYGTFLSPESFVGRWPVMGEPAAARAGSAVAARSEADAWALHAARSSGFGAAEAAMNGSGSSGTPGGAAVSESHCRPGPLGAMGQWLKSIREEWGRRRASFGQARRWRRQKRVLEGLDARLLKDIGVDPSEAGSVAAELVGTALRTRRRVPFPG
jgi:uncharacterized protein YjiS (DUF1127 family)